MLEREFRANFYLWTVLSWKLSEEVLSTIGKRIQVCFNYFNSMGSNVKGVLGTSKESEKNNDVISI